ncbi:MAG: glucuronate isomerase, partial [Bacteroidota bacterium]
MRQFINNDFLLESPSAINLFHNYVSDLPIIDYHCHLSPEDIAKDRQFTNITEAWLENDHYKWRLMRANGVREKYCTG